MQFVDPNYAYPALTFAILGGILQCFSALYLTTVIIAGARLADAFRRRRKLAASLSQRRWRGVCRLWRQAGQRQPELTTNRSIHKLIV